MSIASRTNEYHSSYGEAYWNKALTKKKWSLRGSRAKVRVLVLALKAQGACMGVTKNIF